MPTEELVMLMRVREQARVNQQLRETAQGVDALERAVTRANRNTSSGSSSWFSWGRAMRWAITGAVVTGIYSIASGIEEIAKQTILAGVSFNAMKESAMVTFSTLLGSAPKANALIGQLYDLAAHTPFTFKNVTAGAQQLLAFGFAGERVIPMLRTLANVAAANPLMGEEAVTHLALVLGQIRSSGRLLGQDALQLAQFGINAYQIVADKLGKTYNQTRVLGEKGLIDSTTAINAILEYADRKFGGLAAKQSKTFSGMLSTMQDLASQGAGRLMEPFMPAIERDMARINKFLASPEFEHFGEQFASVIGQVGDLLGPFLSQLLIFAMNLGRTLSPLFESWGRVMIPTLIVTIKLLTVALKFLNDNWYIMQILLSTLTTPARVFNSTLDALNENVRDVSDATGLLRSGLGKVKSLWDWFSKHTSLDLTLGLHLTGPWSTIGGFAKNVGKNIIRAALPFGASGGRQSGWTTVGERGKEVLWLPQGSRLDSAAASASASTGGGGSQPPMVVQLVVDRRVLAETVIDYAQDRANRR